MYVCFSVIYKLLGYNRNQAQVNALLFRVFWPINLQWGPTDEETSRVHLTLCPDHVPGADDHVLDTPI